MSKADALDTIDDVLDYLEKLQDCDDGQPNEAMRLRIHLTEARDAFTRN